MSLAVALNQAQFWLRNATTEELQQFTSNLPLDLNQQEELDDWFDDLTAIDKPFHNPYYWAAFCAIGQ
ncbi:MAG: CHAT domain-containing protein, partial [Moorea sp. SIO3I7]|nr:CHAT domain-containing protein [Moorena sp. SIO3I7]